MMRFASGRLPFSTSQAKPSVVHANDLGGQVDRRLARDIELDLRRRAPRKRSIRRSARIGPQEQPAPRDILDKPVDDDPAGPRLRADADWDPYCFPLVHLW